MAIRKLAAIATACLVLPASATALRPGSVVRQGWAPARETSTAEQIDKSSTGVSPIPTSHPEFAAVDLFQRADYSLPSDYCGWYDEFKSASYTCGLVSASCINIGDYRGCCDGPTSDCASTFYSTCVDLSSIVTEATQCGGSTLCCTLSQYPSCGTIFYSERTNTQSTYTLIDCFSSGFGSIYQMQDYPPTTATSSNGNSASSAVPTTDPEATSQAPSSSGKSKNNAGAIAGGVVGGVAVIGLVILGVVFIYKKRPFDSSEKTAGNNATGGTSTSSQYPYSPTAPQQQQAAVMSTYGMPSGGAPGSQYDPSYGHAQGYPNQAAGYAQPGSSGGYFPSTSPNTKPDGMPSPAIAEMPTPSNQTHELQG